MSTEYVVTITLEFDDEPDMADVLNYLQSSIDGQYIRYDVEDMGVEHE